MCILWEGIQTHGQEHFFQIGRGCDAVENGLSESFNNVILDARKKPIITMLEDIRLYVMQRMCSLRQKGSGWGHFDVCPNIRLALNELKIQQRYFIIHHN